jgi:asparagine N-glycosylation enzyme membrane subunit Stt3
MKTQSIELFPHLRRNESTARYGLPRLNSVMGLTMRAMLALVPALAIVVSSAWLVTIPELVVYLQAVTWAVGFVFLGLAVESERPESALMLSLTGIALLTLAFLSSRVAVELAIVAAMLLAVWLVAALVRR